MPAGEELYKKGGLNNLVNFRGKHLCWSLFNKGSLIKSLYLKETPTQVFSFEICQIYKNTYFEEHLQTAASAWLYITAKHVLKVGSESTSFPTGNKALDTLLILTCSNSTIEILENGE